MLKGVTPKEDFPSIPRFEELMADEHLLISDHTRKYLEDEYYMPGPSIDRANRSRWSEEGSKTLGERAHEEVKRHLSEYEPPGYDETVADELTRLMTNEAKRFGMDKLPDTE
jgi:trimethylamine:corrinoid methyltransferase-like protein